VTRRDNGWRPAWAFLAAAAVFPMAGCGMPAHGSTAGPHHRLVIVLLDETASFVGYWQDCVGLAATVAGRLKPGDAFAAIGIDDHGNDPEDARIAVTIVSPGSLMALGDRKALAKKVKVLERRPSRKPLTDILNAIQQAAIFANSPAMQDYKPMLLFFSDMQQTPRLPGPADIKGWKFANRGEAFCFYVNVTDWVDRSKKGGTSWDGMVGTWTAVLNAAGLDAAPKTNFFQSGDSRVEINRLFPAGF
jgi:hypothetical protein